MIFAENPQGHALLLDLLNLIIKSRRDLNIFITIFAEYFFILWSVELIETSQANQISTWEHELLSIQMIIVLGTARAG